MVALDVSMPRFLYGPERATAVVWAALAEGSKLKSAEAERLKSILSSADIFMLLKDAPASNVSLEALPGAN